jgi:2-hydroxyacyl-CoA lyase 1
LIKGLSTEQGSIQKVVLPPKGGTQRDRILEAAQLLKDAKSPLIVVGKGSAYAKAEALIRELIEKYTSVDFFHTTPLTKDHRTSIQFLPTPMGKGVLPDSHPNNAASARSTALKLADVVLVLGARLNWILHFGDAPKWNPDARIIQVDISLEEIGRNHGDTSLGLVGDIAVVTEQLLSALNGWRWDSRISDYTLRLSESKQKNEIAAAAKAKVDKTPMTYERSFSIIKTVLDRLSPPQEGGIVYVSEGANTMDISRSIFSVEHPRLRLDAGTYATMGIGMGYAIAAHVAYNNSGCPHTAKKKIVALEGDSAFGFSAMEVETMARYQIDVLIFVINNGGVYHGDSLDGDEWLKLQQATVEGVAGKGEGLRSWSLGWEVGYEKIAEAFGGKGFLARTPEELARATEEGFKAKVPVVVNVIIEAGQATKLVGSHIPLWASRRGLTLCNRNSVGKQAPRNP